MTLKSPPWNGLHWVSLWTMLCYQRNSHAAGNGVTFHILGQLLTAKQSPPMSSVTPLPRFSGGSEQVGSTDQPPTGSGTALPPALPRCWADGPGSRRLGNNGRAELTPLSTTDREITRSLSSPLTASQTYFGSQMLKVIISAGSLPVDTTKPGSLTAKLMANAMGHLPFSHFKSAWHPVPDGNILQQNSCGQRKGTRNSGVRG